ncbi:MAG: SDR family oxidoreductase [Bacteroidota bacterium]|nr:SDR family oxidoreductase [Bacteroidota bacterium]
MPTPDPRRLTNQIALVTGASSGIGVAVAKGLAAHGAKVVVNYAHDEKGANATVAAIEAAGGTAMFVRADVTQEDQVRGLVAAAEDTFGGLDFAFNNAGAIAETKPVHEITDEDVTRVMGVNFTGTLLCLRHEIPSMLKRGGGVIVNTSSTAAVRGNPGWGIYAASKAANLHLTRVAAAELGPQGIRVNAVLPGPIDTPLFRVEANRTPGWTERAAGATAVKRMGRPEEVGAAVAWLCSDEASFVTGLAMNVDGGSAMR